MGTRIRVNLPCFVRSYIRKLLFASLNALKLMFVVYNYIDRVSPGDICRVTTSVFIRVKFPKSVG